MFVQISYGKIDPDARYNSHPTSTDYQPFSNFEDLRRDMNDVNIGNFATCEHNQFILDGRQTHFPDNYTDNDWAWWTYSMSDNNGLFEVNPVLDVPLDEMAKSNGITLFFYPFTDDYATKIKVTWYAEDMTTVLHSDIYENKSVICEIIQPVLNYKRLTFEFMQTNIRNRYIKLWGIEFGRFRQIDNSMYGEINSCTITEQISPIAEFMYDNVLTLGLKTLNPEFNLVSGDIEDMMMMSRQTLRVRADGNPYGTYYLDDSASQDVYGTGNTFSYTAYSQTWVMKQYRFMGGIYNDVLAGSVLMDIFDACRMRFRLDDDFDDARITGWIPICNCMEAMQYVCFAIGAIPDPSRHDFVWIYKRDVESSYDLIRRNRYVSGEKIRPTNRYSGVDILTYEYVAGTETVEAQKGVLPVGQHVKEFSEPLHSLEISGAEILQYNANYAIIDVTTQGDVLLTGRKYIVNTRTHTTRQSLLPGEVQRIKPYDKCYIISNEQALERMPEIFTYLNQDLILEFRTQILQGKRMKWLEIEEQYRWQDLEKYTWQELEDGLPFPLEVGYLAYAETSGRPIKGIIDRLKIDLVSGVSDLRISGNLDFLPLMTWEEIEKRFTWAELENRTWREIEGGYR